MLIFYFGDVSKGAKEGKSDRSHQEFYEYLAAKFGFDLAENESSKVFQKVLRQLDRFRTNIGTRKSSRVSQ